MRSHKPLFLTLFFCTLAAGITLFFHIESQNEVTKLRLAIPQIAKEVADIREENVRLQYAIDTFESPRHLYELMKDPSYSHLRFPYLNEEFFVHEK